MADVEAMAAVETAAYPLPWSFKNLQNIVQQQGNTCGSYVVQVLRSLSQSHTVLHGYFVALLGYQDMHLLNLAIHPQYQHQGYAHLLLQRLRQCAVQYGAHTIWLEVRQSNPRAQQMYRRFGFIDVGMRADYYPQTDGSREAALVMQYNLQE